MAEPYAVARCMGGEQVRQSGALFIDVGGGTTDVALVARAASRARGCSRWAGVPSRSRSPTGSSLPFEEAEALKIEHADGRAGRSAERGGRAIIAEDVAVWAAGIELVLEEFGKHGLLPGRIELCGGGSRLPRDPRRSRTRVRARPAVRAAAAGRR